MTTILAIDSATGPCSVALWKDGKVAAYLENLKPSAQSVTLMPMVEQVLKQCGIEYKDLSHVAATIGPGSFTGIRIALAAARGIAFAANLKTMGFTTLEVMAFAVRTQKTPVLPVLNAGKSEHYYQVFETVPQFKPSGQTKLGTLEDAMVLAKSKEAMVIETFPRADVLAELAATHPATAQALTPFYIRPPDAKLPMQKP